MKHSYPFLIVLLLTFALSNLGFSQTDIFDADFSNNGDGFADHTTSSPPAPGPASVGPFGIVPNSWSLSYDSAPFTDGTTNSFKVVGGELQSDDWGGQGIFTSQNIDVSGVSTVDISATGVNSGANDNTFTYFYILDGGSRVETVIGATTNGNPVNYSVIGLDVSGASTLVVGFEFSEDGSGDGYDISEFKVTDTASSFTSVEFTAVSASVSEGVGTYDLTLAITNEDVANATTCDVVLTSGDAADVNSYTTQMVTFPAGSAANQIVTLTITDDGTFEGNETLTFAIQNVAGGNSASVGTNSSFDLTIEDNDPDPSVNLWCEPFDNNYQYTVTLGGEGNSGIEDYFQITDGSNINQSYTGANGNFFAGQDLDDGGWTGSASPSQLTWTGINISDFSNLSFTGAFASNGGGIDTSDFVLVEYQIDSGGWLNLLAFENDGMSANRFFLEDTDFDGTGDGTPLSTTFTPFTKAIGSTGSLLDLRITVSMNSAVEEVAFDDFKVSGIYSGLAYSGGSWTPNAPDGTTGASNAIVLDGTAIFSANASLNDVLVNPSAALQINSGVTLTANSVTLESESFRYSSLILDGSISGTVNYNRAVNSFTNDATNNDNDLISAPLTGQTFGAFDTANANLLASGSTRAFAPFNNDTGAYENFDATANAATTLDAADAYRAATTDGGTLTFTGTVNTGTVFKDITVGTDATFGPWNLLGNPYPSFIDIDAFLTHVVSTQTSGERNIDLLDALSGIYGYDGDASNGWDIITLANASGRFMAPGQGFFVAADAAQVSAHDIEFTPAMRAASTSDDFIAGRNSNLTFLKLNAATANNSYSTEFYFDPNASQGIDQGYDAVIWGGTAPSFALYSHLVQDNTGLPIALQALGAMDYNSVTIPLGLNANPGEQLTFSISESTLPSNVNVYLEDNVANTITLLNANDYVLTPSTSLNGTGRFYINFSVSTLSTSDFGLNGLSIYTNNDDKTVIISGELQQPTTANIFDLQGRLVRTQILDISKRQQHIEASQFSTGIYIVQLQNGVQSISQKVIIR